MRIDLRDPDGRRLGRVEVDPAQRPNLVRVTPPGAPTPEDAGTREPDEPHPQSSYLNWDEALDDAGQLRRCVVCGCPSLYRQKALPQVTPFVVVLAFAGALVGLLGLATNPSVLVALLALLVLDVATLLVARVRLSCYRCGSVYSRLRIARYHRRWDRNEAERIAAERDRASGGAPS